MILSGISIGFESAVYTALVIAAAVYGAFLLSGSIVVSLFAVALAGPAAKRFARFRVGSGAVSTLAEAAPPAWAFLRMRLNPESATEIRARRAAERAAWFPVE